MQLRLTTAVALATGFAAVTASAYLFTGTVRADDDAAPAAIDAPPPMPAAERIAEPDPGPDMRLLSTPAEVHFRVKLGPPGKRFSAKKVKGADGWSIRLGPNGSSDAVWPTPATDGQRVFVGGPLNSSEFYAIRAATGSVAWKAHLSDNGPTPATVRDRRVYFNTQSCTLYAYDAGSGARLWSKYLANHLESIPTVTQESIVTTRPERHGRSAKQNGKVPALTVLSRAGRIVADVDIDGEALGAPILHAGNAYVATREGTLYCVDVEKGAALWKRDCKARGAPWVDDTGVYVAAHDALQAYHPVTGSPRWTYQAVTPSSRDGGRTKPRRAMTPPALRVERAAKTDMQAFWGEGMRPVRIDETLCIAEGRALRFFHRVSGAETAYWELDVKDDFAGAPIVAGDTLVVATHSGEVRGVDTRHGEIIWAVDLGERLASGVVVDDGKLYAMTRTGRLVSVHTGDLRADGWPMWGGTAERVSATTTQTK